MNLSQSGYRVYGTKDLNGFYLVKNLRKTGRSSHALVELYRLSQLRANKEVEVKQKQLLDDQLIELEASLADMERANALLTYN